MARSRSKGGWGRWLVLPLVVLLLAVYGLGLWPGGSPHLTAQKLYQHLASPLLHLLLYMGVGLLVGQAVESLGWAARLGGWVAPVLRWGHFKQECGASFTAAFISGILANTMLETLYQESRISRREQTLTYLFNNALPVFMLHLPTTFFIIWPLTRQAGLIYLGLTLAAAVLRSLVLLVYGRLRLPAPSAGESAAPAQPPQARKKLLQEIWDKFSRRFARVVFYTLPIYLFIFLINDWGVFKWLRDAAAAHVALRFLPMEAASVVIFSVAAEFTSGMAAAGALLQAGALTVHQTVLALVLGNIVATPIRTLRHQLPSNVGIFSPRRGTQLLVLSQAVRLVSLVLVVVPYAVWGLNG